MTAVALDTLRISKRLREAGFSEPQADAVTGVLHDAQEVALGDLVTKADLRDLRSELKADSTGLRSEFRELKTELKLEIADVRADLAAVKADVTILKWGMGIIVAGIIALVMKAFFIG